MDVTMKDVAKLAGVSPSTVSRVLNDSSLVKEETEKKVRKAIDRLNYQVNDSARVLRTNTSRLIGFIGAGMDNPFLTQILKGAESAAIQNEYNLIFGETDGESQQELNYLKIMKQKKIDGIIIISANIQSDLLSEAKNSNIPVVFASGFVNDPELVCVTIDNITAAYEVMNYLFENNYNNIGIIQGPKSDTVASGERMKGVRLAFNSHDKKIDSSLIIEGAFNFKSGYRGAEELLSKNKELDAIFAFNDQMAVGAIRAIEKNGLKVPDDIAVIGFDNIELSKYVNPTLSTVGQSGFELGEKSVSLLYDLINGNKIHNNKIYIPHRLILRKSTK